MNSERVRLGAAAIIASLRPLLCVAWVLAIMGTVRAWGVDASRWDGLQVSAVTVNGLRNVKRQDLQRSIRLQEGRAFSSRVMSEDLDRMEALGSFWTVKAEPSTKDGGVDVVYAVEEKPFIKMISLDRSGTKRAITESKIRETLQSKEATAYSQSLLDQDVTALKKLLLSKGFPNPTITWESGSPDEKNQTLITFRIDTGERVRISKVVIDSEVSIKKRPLKKSLVNRAVFLKYFKGQYDDAALDLDRQRVEAYFRGEGYLAAQVGDPVVEPVQEGKRLRITYPVKAGPLYYVESFAFSGNKVLSSEELAEKLKMQPGDVLSLSELSGNLMDMRQKYWSLGYAYCELDALYPDPKGVQDQAAPSVPVTLQVAEGEIYKVGWVSVAGNAKTRDDVVRREIALVPGDLFDPGKAKTSQRKISNSGYFEEVTWDVGPGKEARERDVTFKVKEMPTGNVNMGFGYSSVDDLVGFVMLQQKNLDVTHLFDAEAWRTGGPVGGGQELSMSAQLGGHSSEFEISFTEPWVLGKPVSLGASIFNTEHEYNDYSEATLGFSTTLGKRIQRFDFVKTFLTYRIEDVTISDVDEDASSVLKEQEGSIRLGSVTATVDRDSRDYPYDPFHGFRVRGSTELGSEFLGGETSYWKVNLDGDFYYTPWERHGARLNVRYGVGDAFGTDLFPLSERYFAGGSQTLRGYESREVGPRDENGDVVGGRTRFLASLEYKIRLTNQPRTNAVLFIDTGNVWEDVGEFGELKVSVGAGFRVIIPIPLELNFATVLNKDSGQDLEPVSFGLGFGF